MVNQDKSYLLLPPFSPVLGGLLPRPPPEGLPVRLGKLGFGLPVLFTAMIKLLVKLKKISDISANHQFELNKLSIFIDCLTDVCSLMEGLIDKWTIKKTILL